jgi:hypothetical protein
VRRRQILRATVGGGLGLGLLVGFAFFLTAALGAASAAAATVTVGSLSVDHMLEPEAIEDTKPTFGWKLIADGRGVKQSAYEVQVAKTEAELLAGTDVWNSGKQTSAESLEIPYGGSSAALEAGHGYFWRVRVWDQSGNPSAWSAPAHWQMALLSESDWHGADWIAPRANVEASTWTDYELSVDFAITSGATGAIFREQDPENFYMWQINIESGEALLRPHIDRNGHFEVLDEVSLGTVITAGELHSVHHLSIKAEGTTIRTYIDGQEVEHLTDSTFGSGGIGFRSGGSSENATFTNLSVKALGGGGSTLFSDSFSTSPDPAFPGAPIEGGGLHAREGRTSLISTAPAAPLLRKAFTLAHSTAEIASAHLYADGLGFYEADISGAKVGNQVLTPSAPIYTGRYRYQTYDVAGDLRNGENVLGMTLAEGYGPEFSPHVPRWLGPRQAIALLEIKYTSGETQRVVTDESWKWDEGPVVRAGIYAGESYDALREQSGWDEPGFDASAWQATRTVSSPGPLEADTTPPVRVIRAVAPVRVTEPASGVYVYDLGENISGWARLHVSAPPGTRIQMRYAEDILPDGHIDPRTNRRAASTDSFVVGNDGNGTWEPTFTYHGFRYVEVTGLPQPATLADLEGRVVHAALGETTQFHSSDAMLDAIFENNRRTMLNNAVSYPTDNPVRDERTDATMDVQAYVDASTREFEADRFFDSYLVGLGGGGWGESPDYNATNVPLAWDLYQQYGDRRALEAFYPGMLSTAEHYEQESSGLIWPEGDPAHDNGYGDWCPPIPEPEAQGGVGGPTAGGYEACFSEVSLVNTAIAYRNTKITAAAAQALGHTAKATEMTDLAEAIETAFESHFATSTGYGSGKQVTSVLPLAFGMVPASRRQSVAENLVARIEGPDKGHLQTGIFGTRFLLDALDAAGRPEVGRTMLDQTSYPGYGYEIGFGAQIGLPPGSGATTDWEEWTYESSMESHDHAMFAGINASFLTDLAGIEATSPGYATFRIAPVVPAGLPEAGASINTVRGPVSSAWTRSGSTFTLAAVVPPNSTALIYLPTEAGTEVRESGVPVGSAPGVEFVREEGSTGIYKVGSGEYHFVVAPPSHESESEEETHQPPAQPQPAPTPPTPTPQKPEAKNEPPRPQLTVTATVVKGGRVQVLLQCAGGCPSGGSKLKVTATGPSGKPVYARVQKPLVHGKLSFAFRPGRGTVVKRLRLQVVGLPVGAETVYANLSKAR